jgi:alanine dehydrogenase
MPGAVSHTSTWALTNVTIPYAVDIANRGIVAAARRSKPVLLGLNTFGGGVVYGPVAQAVGMEHTPIDKVLQA